MEYERLKIYSEGVMRVDARIRDSARKLEDAIETAASAQLIESESHGRVSLNLDRLKHDVDCFVEGTDTMKAEYRRELKRAPPRESAAAAASSTSSPDMVGLSDLFLEIRDSIVADDSGHVSSFAITGMAGIGKTALAKKLLEDSLVKEKFKCRAFVRIGQPEEYGYNEIMSSIISQLSDGEVIMEEGDGYIDFGKLLENCLQGRKFLIVLDDVWDLFFQGNLTDMLPENGYILPTSRIEESSRVQWYSTHSYQMRLMNEEESWELLSREVFGEGGDGCPPQLVKAGKKIAQNCDGLPLLILAVAKHLSELEKSLEYWKEVAKQRNSAMEDAIDQIYEVLLSSYHYMELNAKACFLYMGVFPQDYVARYSRILYLWRAERFAVFDNGGGALVDYLLKINIVVARLVSSAGKVKGCNLHVVYRHLSRREGERNGFLHILSTYSDGGSIGGDERTEEKRRLAIHHNTLLAIKEVHSSVASCSTLRSVLCTGPYHQYQVPIFCELKLLRLLDALSIRFYEFPVELMELIQLRYLSLSTNASLPPSINQLWFLEYLIVHQHSRIIKYDSRRSHGEAADPSYVPVEIWELQHLEHLHIIGRNLPHPPPGAALPNLTHLLDVGVQTCTKQVLENLPKLEKLRIRIESAPDGNDGGQVNSCFHHISCLEKLVSLTTAVTNPSFLRRPKAPLPRLISILAPSLGKLTLSGLGYPWEDMSIIAQLPCLRVLKLQSYAFCGEKWETDDEMRFESLRILSIEDTDLVCWTTPRRSEPFPILGLLTLKNCHKLQEIPVSWRALHKVEVADCNPLVERWGELVWGIQLQVDHSWK